MAFELFCNSGKLNHLLAVVIPIALNKWQFYRNLKKNCISLEIANSLL
jgi:hypothetical protein